MPRVSANNLAVTALPFPCLGLAFSLLAGLGIWEPRRRKKRVFEPVWQHSFSGIRQNSL